MPDVQLHFSFWAQVLLLFVGLWLTLSVPHLRGKAWLIAFLVTRFAGPAFSYSLALVPDYRALLQSGVFFVGVVNILGYGALVAFLLVRAPIVGTNMEISRVLFSFHGRLTRQLFWIVSITLYATTVYILLNAVSSRVVSRAPLVTYLVWLPIGMWIGLATQVKSGGTTETGPGGGC